MDPEYTFPLSSLSCLHSFEHKSASLCTCQRWRQDRCAILLRSSKFSFINILASIATSILCLHKDYFLKTNNLTKKNICTQSNTFPSWWHFPQTFACLRSIWSQLNREAAGWKGLVGMPRDAVFMTADTIALSFQPVIVCAAKKYAWRTSMINGLGSCTKWCMNYREIIWWMHGL